MSDLSARIAYLRERLQQRFDPAEHDELQRLTAPGEPTPAPEPEPPADDDTAARRTPHRSRATEIQSP